MHVTAVTAIPLAIPLRPCVPEPPWRRAVAKQVLVRLDTDGGLTGWGECFPYGAPLAVCNVVDEILASLLIGHDPTALEAIVETMHRALMIPGRRGIGLFALSGVELALWDLAGKVRGVPVHTLLGAAARTRLPACASLLRYATPSDVALAAAAAAAMGFTAIKLHQTDVESVAAAREAAGPGIEIMLDANCAWSVDEAIEMGRRLEAHDLTWLEEPVWPPEDHAGLAAVRAAVPIPIAAGENESTAFDFRSLLDAGGADIIQPSVTKVGGIGAMRNIATLAAAAGVTLAPHSFYFGPGLAATVHVAAVTPDIPYVEFLPGDLDAPVMREPLRRFDGAIAVPQRPGLGADPDATVLARYPYQRDVTRSFVLMP